MRPATDLAAAPRLEKVLTATPANRPVAAALARIYLQAGRHRRRPSRPRRRPPPPPIRRRPAGAARPRRRHARRRGIGPSEFVKQQPDRTEARLDLASTLISRGKQDDARASSNR
ncbi:MAG: hypothetical protein U0736_07215 [Gemmataceae bacterium]